MSGIVLLDQVSPGARKRTRVIADPASGLPLIVTEQDTGAILAANRRASNDYDPAAARRNPSRMRRIAEIPNVVWMQLQQQGIVRGFHVLDHRAFMRVLSDPDNRWLRTDNGRRLA